MWLLAALGQPAVEGEVDGVQRDPNEGAHPGRLATRSATTTPPGRHAPADDHESVSGAARRVGESAHG